MRRFLFFATTVMTIFICVSLCACVNNQPKNSIEFFAESELFTGFDDDFFIIVKQRAQGQLYLDNSSYSYEYTEYSVTLVPLKLDAEKYNVQVLYQGKEQLICDGNFTVCTTGMATDDGITLVYGDVIKEIYLEKDIVVDFEKIFNMLLSYGESRISADGKIEIKFLLDYRGAFIFCGYYREEALVCAVLCDGDGNYLTHI